MALKIAEVAAAATVTEAGTVSVEFVFDKMTLAPPLGAGWVSVTVQVLEESARGWWDCRRARTPAPVPPGSRWPWRSCCCRSR